MVPNRSCGRLITHAPQLIRIRVHGSGGDSIRIASRKTHGVRLFDVADDENEKVVSAGIVRENEDEDVARPDDGSKSDVEDRACTAATSADMDSEDLSNEEKIP